MLPMIRYFGHVYYWPSWVHLLVMGLIVFSCTIVIASIMARSARHSRVFGLPIDFVSGLGNLSLSVLAHAQAQHVWQMSLAGALYAFAGAFLVVTIVQLWNGGANASAVSVGFHLFLLGGLIIAGLLEVARRTAYWIPMPVIAVAVLLAVFGAFVIGRNSR